MKEFILYGSVLSDQQKVTELASHNSITDSVQRVVGSTGCSLLLIKL